jgi:predicted aminopeptidase
MAVSNIIKLASAVAAVAAIASCQTMGYYAQAIGGQMELWQATKPIEQWVRDDRTEPALRQRLARVADIRDFASRELALPDNDTFRGYADLHRPYVVWNVFAAAEFSLDPVQWCFPFAGCVAYRGYFSEEGAQRFGAKLQDDGLDVFVGGVPAYSTLGWFNDPVLNTFVNYHEAELARLIFHELAHQVAYVTDDTAFNESFATAVELEGVHRWIDARATPDVQQAFDEAQVRKRQFLSLVGATRSSLKDLYARDLPKEHKRAAKAEAFRALLADYAALKQSWGGFNGYDRWFQQPLNNAKLVSVAAYFDHVAAFQRMIGEADGDLAAFYAEVRKLARLPKAQRLARLDAQAQASRGKRPALDKSS